jgi:hypothetical protein
VRYHMALLLGKPVKEQVVTLWISRTQWTVDTPEGKHERYLEVRDLHFEKQVFTPQLLMNELTISVQQSEIGQKWLRDLQEQLEFQEACRDANTSEWVLTYAVIDDAAEKIRENAVVENQREAATSQSAAVRGRGTRTMNALLQGKAASQREAPSSRGSFQSRSPSPYSGGQRNSGSKHGDMAHCDACMCKHFENGGPGQCPYRCLHSNGEVAKWPQFNGWDPVYFATKSKNVRDIMAYRASKASQPARVDLDTWKLFIAEVDRELQRSGRN